MKLRCYVGFAALGLVVSRPSLSAGCSVKIKCENGGHSTCDATPALDDDGNSANNGPAYCGKLKPTDHVLACSTSVPVDNVVVRGRTAQYSFVCCDKEGTAISGIINKGHTVPQSFGTTKCQSLGTIEEVQYT